MHVTKLFEPLQLGPFRLLHRVVMPPLTRMRAPEPDNAPDELNAEYYAQRTSQGGLIIAEATSVTASGKPYPATPGIHSSRQIDGWRKVTDAVHAKGGVIFLQLWHGGRIGHSSLLPGAQLPVGPSPVRARGEAYTATGEKVPYETPAELDAEGITEIVDAFHQGAHHAMAAGFDGVEIHGANGYLIEQFLQSRTNLRTDAYGGSIENRSRFLIEVTKAASDAAGADRVGVRLSPYGKAGDSGEDDPLPLYTHAIKALAPLGLAYLHLIEPRSSGVGAAEVDHQDQPSAAALFRPLWPGVLITAGGFDAQSAAEAIAAGQADAIGFGRAFIANPDLPARIRTGAALNAYDRLTFYSKGPRGYTDYGVLGVSAPAEWRSGRAPRS